MKQQFIDLGWLICELKYLYYYTDRTHLPINDTEYDAIESQYEELGKSLNIDESRFASKRVGLCVDSGAGKLIHEAFKRSPLLPGLRQYMKQKGRNVK